MKDRIKQIRSDAGFTQEQFAKDLGVSITNIKFYETGRRIPSDAFISLLCNKYNVNETWLRTGEGEMKAPITREEEIASITAQLYKGNNASIKYKLILMISQMSESDLEKFVDAAKHIAEFMEEENENGLE